MKCRRCKTNRKSNRRVLAGNDKESKLLAKSNTHIHIWQYGLYYGDIGDWE